MRQKAAERNPDEFRFGMTSSKTYDKGQKVSDRGNPELSQDVVKLLKTQDIGYLRTTAQKTRRERERLEQVYNIQGDTNDSLPPHKSQHSPGRNQHTIFVETKYLKDLLGSQTAVNEDKNKKSNILEEQSMVIHSNTSNTHLNEGDRPNQSSQTENQSSSHLETSKDLRLVKMNQTSRKQRRRNQEVRESKLRLLKSREKELLAAVQELEIQRAKMSNSIGGTSKAGVKWKIRERKK